MQKLSTIPTKAAIQETHQNIAKFVHQTLVLTNTAINKMAGAHLFFKCENFQKIGAFKMRGASSAALRLSDKEKQAGLATHSSGNHAQAVALTAKLMGIPAHIVMPNTSPSIKIAATKGYGATVYLCENTLQAREEGLAKVVEKTGATFIHPFDDYNVIAGQATVAKELIEELPNLDIIIAPVGGGGLMSGTALSGQYFAPQTTILGAEPQIVDDAFRSLQTGILQQNKAINTIADGLRTNLSEKTFGIIRQNVSDIFTVSESDILAAMLLTFQRMKIVIEPSSAVPLAAILANPTVFAGKKVGVIITGGNVDVANFWR